MCTKFPCTKLEAQNRMHEISMHEIGVIPKIYSKDAFITFDLIRLLKPQFYGVVDLKGEIHYDNLV